MINRLNSLLWLRYRYLLANKMIFFVCVLTPLLDFGILNAIPDVHGEVFFLNMALVTVYSLTAGTFVTLLVSEEKDKKNLRTLMITGVTSSEYILSVLSYPIVLAFVSLLVLPYLFGLPLTHFVTYSTMAGLTSLAFALINFIIALITKNQA